MKGLSDPTHFVENGSRDELKQLGQGEKITVIAGHSRRRKGLAVLQCFDANCFYSARNRPTRAQGQFATFDIVSPKRSQSFVIDGQRFGRE